MRITFCRLRLFVVMWMLPSERHRYLMPPDAEFLEHYDNVAVAMLVVWRSRRTTLPKVPFDVLLCVLFVDPKKGSREARKVCSLP